MQKIIDCHCHVYPDKVARRAVEGIGAFYDLPMCCDGTLRDLTEKGAAAGITHYLIFSVATKPSQTRSINEFIAALARDSGGRMTGLGTLHPDSPDLEGDIAHLEELGLKGVKLHPDTQGFKLDDYRCLKIYSLCEGRLPLLLHTGDRRYDYSNPNRLKPILEIYPGLTVIAAHLGGWSIWEEAAQELHGYPNLYVDCSSSLFALTPARAAELIRLYGSDRVLFGTDYPMWLPLEEVARFNALPLEEEERQRILHGNAERLFGLTD